MMIQLFFLAMAMISASVKEASEYSQTWTNAEVYLFCNTGTIVREMLASMKKQ